MSKGTSRSARTVRSLLIMGVLGAGLAFYSIYANGRDIRWATGPRSEDQHQFFVNAATRPDIGVFFKGLSPKQRLEMSADIARYDDPAMATLIGKCLETFDPAARKVLTQSMSIIAKTQPKAVAHQLELKGSFQQLAVSTALAQRGAAAYPMIAERLTNGDARPNASSLLVAAGEAAVPSVMPYLESKDKDVRLAAADVLGKIRARRAVDSLTARYLASKGDEHFGYLASLAGIGDPKTEPLLVAAIRDESLPVPQRSQAALGLGRIASASAVKELWRYADDDQKQLAESAISALQVAGDAALAQPISDRPTVLTVAEGVHTTKATLMLQDALKDPQLLPLAARLGHNRPEMVPSLIAALLAVRPNDQGEIADDLVRSLVTTPEGTRALEAIKNPALRGIIDRRLMLRMNRV